MASNGKKGGHSSGVGKIFATLGVILAICVALAILIMTGTLGNSVVTSWVGFDRQMSSLDDAKPSGSDLNSVNKGGRNLGPSEADRKSLDWGNLYPSEKDRTGVDFDKSSVKNDTQTDSTNQNMPLEGEKIGQETTNTANGIPNASYAPIDAQTALKKARAIKTATPHTDGYAGRRAQLFDTWQNSTHLCGRGTVRDYVLARDMTDVTSNTKTCKVEAGNLQDPYTDTKVHFLKQNASDVQIDHVVALYDAWASGLYKADQKTRDTYANDPEVLLASKGSANQEKSEGVNLEGRGVPSKYAKKWKAHTDSVWLPSNKSYQCGYMEKRVYLKDKYGLTMSAWEKSETVGLLEKCVAGE